MFHVILGSDTLMFQFRRFCALRTGRLYITNTPHLLITPRESQGGGWTKRIQSDMGGGGVKKSHFCQDVFDGWALIQSRPLFKIFQKIEGFESYRLLIYKDCLHQLSSEYWKFNFIINIENLIKEMKRNLVNSLCKK